jgi:CRISPR-associated protein Cas1
MSDEPPLRVMALHALLYCKRLFYLEEVEEIRVADAAVFAGRELHAAVDADEDAEWSSIEVESKALGLFGKIDYLRRRNGKLIPYEHKRGRARRTDGVAEPWPSDRVQAVAYAMLLAEATGQDVPEARVHYHADNVTVRVPVDDAARQLVVESVTEAKRLRATVERPPITDNERLCVRCSLAPVCLPEEVRHQDDPGHEPRRLFPADDDRGTLHVLSHGARVGRSGDVLTVTPRADDPDAKPTRHPAREVGALVLHGFAQASTQALRMCVHRDISVHWLTASGTYLAGLTPGAGAVQRRVRQYRALADPTTCLRLAKALVHAKVQGQHRYLLRATRENHEARGQIDNALRSISQTLEQIGTATDADTLRGFEGEAAVQYLGSLNALLSPNVAAELRYGGRSRRPPRDRFNAILSFGYGLLHAAVMRAILAVGLEPALGFFHRPRSAAHPLVLDLMELFRVPLWDLVVIGSLNRGQWDPEADFTVTRAKVWLSDSGRRKAIELFERRLEESWKHPVLQYSLSYARTIELEARLLEKEWTGEPGLFAQARLR